MKLLKLSIAVQLFLLVRIYGLAESFAQTPDVIFYNAKVVTVDASFSIQQAFAVSGERFAAVGANKSIRALAGPQTKLVDLKGRTVIPGLMDNHNHQYHVGLVMERGTSLEGVDSIPEMQERLRNAASLLPTGAVIYGQMGWESERLAEKRPPTRIELDQAAPNNPVVIYQARGLAYLNSAAFAKLGVTRQTKSLGVAAIPRDSAGEPTGMLQGVPYSVLGPTTGLLPPTLEEKKLFILIIQKKQLALGLTSVRDLQLTPDAMRAYYELHREGKLLQRVSMGLEVNPDQAGQIESMLAAVGVGTGFGDHWLRLDGIAEFNPGSMMREPYTNQPGTVGAANLSAESYAQAVRTANRFGWRVSPHVDGDRALDFVLDAYEAADRDSSIRGKRWIVEHAVISHPDQMDRLKRLGVLVSAQAQPNEGAAGMVTRYGKERAESALPIRDWLDHGLIVSSGSDWPGPDNNPFETIQFYVTRRAHGYGIIGANQKISREQALRIGTINNAYFTFEESEKGSIEAKKLADFLILSADILSVPEEQVGAIIPLATYVGGRERYRAENAAF
ncbi:MAG TPA: amidohydrolase [Candidatus Saccharimonadales bacterium]|nr:amidohydrolase [Candidatus Saccharimonadales bacterium]